MITRFVPKFRRHHAPALLLSASLLAYGTTREQHALRTENSNGKNLSSSASIDVAKRNDPDSKVSASGKVITSGDSERDSKGWFGDDDNAAWTSFSNKLYRTGAAVSSFEWSSVGDRITDLVIPEWVQSLPHYVRKLQSELSVSPGSLADEIYQEAEDASINPEILWNGRVRIGKDLCVEEQAFQHRRREYTTRALARYLAIPEDEVHPDDVPTIAMCGSGGGLRALVAGASSYLSAQEAGLFDCVTYTAGVSGSCWLQTLYHSSLAGQNYRKLIEHLKRRIGTHIAFPPPALNLLTSAPTNKFLLSGIVEKARSDPEADFGLVDVYGLLLASRLLVPRGELEVDSRDLKISNQRVNTDNGTSPMPIYTAVRHEIPLDEVETIKVNMQTHPAEEIKEKAKRESWFQWFEWSPYEFWCEELEAGIPTWSLGRKFNQGVNVPRDNGLGLPELRVPQLMGIWGSAFCATLSHYYKEVQPIVRGITGFGGVDDLMEDRNDDLIKVHPIDPASIPNFALGLEKQLPPTCPKSLFSSTHLQLMDAGMSNNLPIYPLLRPGRDIDIIIAFDASAEVKKDNWLSVADGYAKQRGIKGWPVGIGWPQEGKAQEQTVRELESAQASTASEAAAKVAEASKAAAKGPPDTKESLGPAGSSSSDLGYCTVWIGTLQERSSSASSPPSKQAQPDADWDLLAGPESGIAVVYFPLLANPKVEGVDPLTSEFLSTWNFVYTPEEIDRVVALAKANFEEGSEQTRRCVRAIYERKKRLRVRREGREMSERWRRRLKGEANHFS